MLLVLEVERPFEKLAAHRWIFRPQSPRSPGRGPGCSTRASLSRAGAPALPWRHQCFRSLRRPSGPCPPAPKRIKVQLLNQSRVSWLGPLLDGSSAAPRHSKGHPTTPSAYRRPKPRHQPWQRPGSPRKPQRLHQKRPHSSRGSRSFAATRQLPKAGSQHRRRGKSLPKPKPGKQCKPWPRHPCHHCPWPGAHPPPLQELQLLRCQTAWLPNLRRTCR